MEQTLGAMGIESPNGGSVTDDPDNSGSGRHTINSFAVASLVSGLCSLIPFPGAVILAYSGADAITEIIRPVLFPVLFPGASLLGIVTGHVARHKLRWEYGQGARMALRGLVLSYLTLIGGVLCIAGVIWALSQFS
ncbi:hypothetical protein Aple_093090 [Acrocarpospora pleiomorpha]|uniref:DUF4190 domain-containing protein n=1 Tax=Acrocarpospora pleiomorpha TaxID=90975 RepID=A0A5M3XZG4_9ACTN|nr:hypothetical protein [Acrocarpospora pleiomorpha]GES26410.1 hypothetical protein Aple_093090 [Acrocarpospora pleiomorpha]